MGVAMYIFVECQPGRALEINEKVRKIAGVTRAHTVTGPYDLIVLAEARDVPTLADLIVGKVQKIPGVVRTTTSVIVD